MRKSRKYISGSDPFPVMSYLARKLNVIAMRICTTHSTALYPAVIWEVYGSTDMNADTPGYLRSISVAKNNGWEFFSSGTPFEFENINLYSLPKKRDRLTKAHLDQYLKNFGLSVFEQSFYTVSKNTPALVLEKIKRWTELPKEFTLSEVVAGLHWKK